MISIAIKYLFFAVIAIIFNLGTQYVSGVIYKGQFDYYVALFLGTFVGLVTKYILDKKYIFYYTVKDKKEDASKFFVYSVMGVITTGIFWGFQTSFHYLLDFAAAKYLGAIIGLSIGYFVKYQLDKRFVFKIVDRADIVKKRKK